MNKLCGGIFAALVVCALPLVVSAAENTELIDELAADAPQLSDVTFQTFASCDAMSTTLTEFVKENFDQWHGGPMPYRRGGMIDDVAVMADQDV